METDTATIELGSVRAVHFVGIGGVGMSAIASVLLHLGYRVSGSDLKRSSLLERLEAQGARVFIGHDASHVGDAELVVVTSAVPMDNPEIIEARRRNIPVLPRPEALGQILSRYRGIAVSGTHGKSTTSAMIALVLERCGCDPTVLVGGEIREFKGNARLGNSDLCVIEADEYRAAFLHMPPAMAVVTNIEPEHMEFYETEENLLNAFRQFIASAREGAVLCADDANVRRVMDAAVKRWTYGFSDDADLTARHVRCWAHQTTFAIYWHGEPVGEGTLNVPGKHNVLNACAALIVAHYLGLSWADALAALASFRGVCRRFELIGEVDGVLVFDDYAHHPTEVAATIAAAREGYEGRRVFVAFQPHLYSRTQRFVEAFATSLAAADGVVVAEIYPAREQPIAGVSGQLIVEAIRRRFPQMRLAFAPTKEETLPLLRVWLRAGDLVIFMGAGDIGEMAGKMVSGP
ncbi:MAG: UDP-N-acetylmuramate--L-alanine ligase [Abditibacteriales bacterium]|nr:UDP-N-acetylmuramate--L-alanine ligase [Abditibacteriales bacterium]MDW8366978.1 UDP-N-acetylmuramate--L-alanine ligase [Abditibacteriales bacterium]